MPIQLPKFISENVVLKITSANALVVSTRLLISVFVQRIISGVVGEAGYAIIGQVRNIMALLTSVSSFGVFSGIVKYVSEFKDNNKELKELFSSVSVFVLVGVLLSSLVLFFGSNYWSHYIFGNAEYQFLFQLLAVVVPFIAMSKVFNAVVHGLVAYKNYAKIELFSYIFGALLSVLGAKFYGLKGVVCAIAVVPVIQFFTLVFIFGNTLKNYIPFKQLNLSLVYKNRLISFTIMSFVAAFLVNLVEIDIINVIKKGVGEVQAGNWVAVSFISKNYMVFATGVYTLYVLPKFAAIKTKIQFKNEVLNIYKTMLPIFAFGMLLVYVLRYVILAFIYPHFSAEAIAPLFKWQLLGDFVKLCATIVAYQFLAKRLVKSFVITEVLSVVLFYTLTKAFIPYYGTQGVVIAHFVRYIVYFIAVTVCVWYYFKTKTTNA